MAQGPTLLTRPSPLGRPRGSQFQLWRSPLTRVHLIFLLLSSLYITSRHLEAAPAVALLATFAAIGELTPAAWRRFLIAEVLLLVGGVISFMWVWESNRPANPDIQLFEGWVRMVFVAWLLIPSRPGYLRWMAALIAVEIAITTMDHAPDWRIAGLIAAAIAALAWDAHLRIAVLRPGDIVLAASRRASALRWCSITTVMVLALAFPIGLGVHHFIAPQPVHLDPVDATAVANRIGANRLDNHMSLGESRFGDQNPVVMATLTFEQNIPVDRYYLRALTLPKLQFGNSSISWHAEQTVSEKLPESPLLHNGEHQGLVRVWRRRALADNTVLRPDGAAQVNLLDCFGDTDGNVFREGIGEIDTSYEAEVGDRVAPPAPWTVPRSQRNKDIPFGIEARLRNQIPQLDTWRNVDPEVAALAIGAWLQSRCTYQLADFPQPPQEPAGQIMQFMFDEDPNHRVGHCQFFSSAAVLLLRAAGHHARCVIGYTSDEVYGRRVIFRSLNAHAWLEVLIENGEQSFWQRVDPTPPDFLTQRTQGLELSDPGGDESDEFADQETNANNTSSDGFNTSNAWILFGFMLATTAGGCIWWWNRRGDNSDRRERILARHTEALIKIAGDIGVPVRQASTLTMIAKDVQTRSGVNLEPYLEAHLQARFNDGPIPQSWPITEIRNAVSTQSTTSHHSHSPAHSLP